MSVFYGKQDRLQSQSRPIDQYFFIFFSGGGRRGKTFIPHDTSAAGKTSLPVSVIKLLLYDNSHSFDDK